MNTEVEEKSVRERKIQEYKESKLLKAFENNLEISRLNLHNKFDSFEEWELVKSKRLLYEINRESNRYQRFPRGSIVKVDFGVNIGSEFSQQHFAITLNKKDNMYNPVITVIPLTSKDKKGRKNLGSLIVDMYLYKLQEEVSKLQESLNEIDIENCEFNPNYINEIDKINSILSYYKKTKENLSYACVDQIRTVSKLNILPAINEYDIVGKCVCDKEVMDKIDSELIKLFTGVDFVKFQEWNENV